MDGWVYHNKWRELYLPHSHIGIKWKDVLITMSLSGHRNQPGFFQSERKLLYSRNPVTKIIKRATE